MDKRDYYEVLGITKGADDAAIKRAYRQMAKKYHPDVNPGDKSAEEKFKEVNEAYTVLSDPQKRARYDQFGFNDPSAGGGSGFSGFDGFSGFGGGGFGGFEDIFSSFFGGGAGASARRNAPTQGDDLRYDLTISFEEAAKGCEKEISFPHIILCPDCKGSGAKKGCTPVTCAKCHGNGVETVFSQTPLGRVQTRRNCSACGGRGKTVSDPCTKCSGKGKVRYTERLKVTIPAGIDDGQAVRQSGYGNVGENGGPAGDLHVVVTVRPHKYFTRDGYNLFVEIPISFTQAALGAEIDVPTLDKPVKYSIPEGAQTGTQFRIRGQGIPYLRSASKGDLYVTVRVETPKKLTDKQKTLLREFDNTMTGREYEQKKSFFERIKNAFDV